MIVSKNKKIHEPIQISHSGSGGDRNFTYPYNPSIEWQDKQTVDSDKTPTRYVMSFVVKFPHEGDTAYLAHCYPYRYSGNMNWQRDCCKTAPLCRHDGGSGPAAGRPRPGQVLHSEGSLPQVGNSGWSALHPAVCTAWPGTRSRCSPSPAPRPRQGIWRTDR